MRIFSQNGIYDLPYENIVLDINDNVIVAYTPMTTPLRIAQYKSREKAEKAMQMLHDNYAYNWKLEHGLQPYYGDEPIVFRFPNEDGL